MWRQGRTEPFVLMINSSFTLMDGIDQVATQSGSGPYVPSPSLPILLPFPGILPWLRQNRKINTKQKVGIRQRSAEYLNCVLKMPVTRIFFCGGGKSFWQRQSKGGGVAGTTFVVRRVQSTSACTFWDARIVKRRDQNSTKIVLFYENETIAY